MKTASLATAFAFAATFCFAQQANVRLDAAKLAWNTEGATLQAIEWNDSHISAGEMDGHWFASVRVTADNAAGLQFLIGDLTLPAGARLYLIQPGTNGGTEMIRAIYQGSGPLDGTEFWSDAVVGSEAILRVVYEGDAASGLPFRISGARLLTEQGLSALKPTSTQDSNEGTMGAAQFRGRSVTTTIRGGIATAEGDIMIGAEDIETPSGKDGLVRQSMGITSTSYRWPSGVIPYTIDPALPNQTRVSDAVAHWNTQLAGVIRLVPRTTETYYVQFTYSSNAGLCSSYIGMVRMAKQPINIGNYCSAGNIIHEIGHAVGLFHEHTREDRNSFVQILYANIQSSAVSNFDQAISISDDLGAYDYSSIMHYPANAFSSNGQPTIVTIPAGIPIGWRTTLSAGDIAGARKMYGASTTTPAPTPGTVHVTLNSNPTGRTLVVDGANVTTPIAFNWTAGGAHSVSAPSAAGTTSKFTFTSWSDGGTQTHTYTTPSTTAALTANFAAAYKITAVSSSPTLGTVTVSPSSADSFYAQNAAVTIAAAGSNGGCLSGWGGISAPATSPLQLSATQSYALTANFQTGAVSLPYSGVSASWLGGTGSLPVNASAGCSWTASTTLPWVQILSSAGTGSGYVRITILQNPTSSIRTGVLNIGNASMQVIQYGR